MNNNIPWFILLCPLISALVILLFTRKSGETSAMLSVGAVGLSFLGAIVAFLGPNTYEPSSIPFISLPGFHIPIGVVVDDLSKVMLLVVTGVGLLVHIYSTVYMKDDPAKARFFGGLSLFMFSMLGIVLADNFVMMFIFWELVGVSSYLLIGHWFTRETAAAAANKAFITNRIGDFGFMIGILMVWTATGAVGFHDLQSRETLLKLTQMPTYLSIAAICLFCGAVGKSAQFPLHVWLPDAMEGPTPVSALIHAATMVAAGVYMLARIFFIVGQSHDALAVISWIGIITAVLAALMATQQDDIKRILAYSTLSQLGYMVCAVGLGAPQAAMFHLFTHAFFKALLFLGAGAVIYALHHEQNIWRMGGLWRRMPRTFGAFAIGTLALMGCWPFAGFFSKDAVLMAAASGTAVSPHTVSNQLIFGLALVVALLTAFYMGRLVVVAFLGKARTHEAEHGHDGPAFMTWPLLILAALSIVAGWPFIAHGVFGGGFIEQLESTRHQGFVPLMATAAFLIGAILSIVVYARAEKEPLTFALFRDKFYIDEFYTALIAGTHDLLALLSGFIDKWIIDGLFVRGLSGATWGVGFVLRFLQFGNLQGYAFLFGAGAVVLLFVMLWVR
jgi:NADH-quinone oxidoreductase subunit L